jgi:hypothetical protein
MMANSPKMFAFITAPKKSPKAAIIVVVIVAGMISQPNIF